jgi:hypothetical protein
MEYGIYNSNDDFCHSGIKGMRWGIRRYQNKDGSLTPAGKRRYNAEMERLKEEERILKKRKATKAKIDRLEAKRKAIDEEKNALDGSKIKLKKNDPDGSAAIKKSEKKAVGEMTDDELARAINRARMEDTYRQLRPDPVVENHPLMKKVVDEIVVPSAINAGKNLAQNVMNKAVEQLTKGAVDPDSLAAIKQTYEKLDYKQRIDKILNPDKYLSEDDRTKRYEREVKISDRESKMRGFKDAPDEAQQKREAEKAAQKVAADDAARVANESKSKEYYDSTYRTKGGDKAYVNPNESRGLSVYNPPVTSISSNTVSRGRDYVESWEQYVDVTNDRSYPGNSSAVAVGQRAIAGLLPAPKDDD